MLWMKEYYNKVKKEGNQKKKKKVKKEKAKN